MSHGARGVTHTATGRWDLTPPPLPALSGLVPWRQRWSGPPAAIPCCAAGWHEGGGGLGGHASFSKSLCRHQLTHLSNALTEVLMPPWCGPGAQSNQALCPAHRRRQPLGGRAQHGARVPGSSSPAALRPHRRGPATCTRHRLHSQTRGVAHPDTKHGGGRRQEDTGAISHLSGAVEPRRPPPRWRGALVESLPLPVQGACSPLQLRCKAGAGGNRPAGSSTMQA